MPLSILRGNFLVSGKKFFGGGPNGRGSNCLDFYKINGKCYFCMLSLTPEID
jgi:hypothetical protein